MRVKDQILNKGIIKIWNQVKYLIYISYLIMALFIIAMINTLIFLFRSYLKTFRIWRDDPKAIKLFFWPFNRKSGDKYLEVRNLGKSHFKFNFVIILLVVICCLSILINEGMLK